MVFNNKKGKNGKYTNSYLKKKNQEREKGKKKKKKSEWKKSG